MIQGKPPHHSQLSSHILIFSSMTCRLPQTPRTPTTAASHYFDDIFNHQGKPRKPHHLRRSSTTRSIGARSDWETSTNGDDEASTPINRTNSVGYLNADDIAAKEEVDQRVAHYVSGQLEKIRSNDSAELDAGEFETSLDGTLDNKPNGRRNRKGGGDYFDNDPYFSK